MNKKVLLIIGGIVLLLVVFVAGSFAGPQLMRIVPGADALAVGGPGGRLAGGPMANLTDEERSQLQGMSESERQAFLQEKMGGAVPPGGAGGRGGQRVIEGEVLSQEADAIVVKTDSGGSQSVYVNADTVHAFAKGAEQTDLAVGDTVTVIAEQEGDNVIAASMIVIE